MHVESIPFVQCERHLKKRMGMTKTEILREFQLFSVGTGGIGTWLTDRTDDKVFDRLSTIEHDPITKVQLNQLLVLSHEAPVSDGFFRYYWLSVPVHFYPVDRVPGYSESWTKSDAIMSLEHLKWGLYRLYTDGLLCFGNVRAAFRKLRAMDHHELCDFFGEKRFDTEQIKRRGPALQLKSISKDDRYLISEMACKSYGDKFIPGPPPAGRR